MLQSVVGQGSAAAGKFDPNIVFAFFPAANFQQSHFAGMADMSAAAGAAVAILYGNQTDLFELRARFLAKRISGQLGGFDEFGIDGTIAEDDGIGGVLNNLGLFG